MTRANRSRSFVVFAGEARWHVAATAGGDPVVGDAQVPPGADAEAVAEAVSRALVRLGYRGQGVVLAVPSGWCLCAPVSVGNAARKVSRQSLLFRFEDKLPVPAEEVAADFVGAGEEVLGVCVRVATVGPLVEALEAAGVPVESICPTALLAVQASAAGGAGSQADAWLWGDGDRADLLALRDGRPHRWYALARPAALALHLDRAAAAGRVKPLALRAVAVPEPLLDAARLDPAVSVEASGGPAMLAAAAGGAGRVLAGRLSPWVDLRRDALAPADAYRRFRRPLTAAAAACLAFLACLAAALFWRAAHYQRVADGYRDEQRAVFARTFPGEPFPATPRSRLASEERKLTAAAGGGGAGGPAQASAMPVLHRLLTHLPADVRYRVEALRLTSGRLTMEAQAKSFADVEAVAAALRDGGGFKVELPRSEQTGGLTGGGGVSFTLTATAPPAPAGRPGPVPGSAPTGAVAKPPASRPTDADAGTDAADADADAADTADEDRPKRRSGGSPDGGAEP